MIHEIDGADLRACIDKAFDAGKVAMIDKALHWLEENADRYTWFNEEDCESGMTDDFYDDFLKAMKKVKDGV